MPGTIVFAGKMKKSQKIILGLVMLLPVLLAVTFNLWSGNPSRAEASMSVTGVSPLAAPIRNLWGAPKSEKIDLAFSRTGDSISWTWNRETPNKQPGLDYIQPIYPNARLTLKNPLTVNDIESFNLYSDFTFTSKPAGRYNLAFDIFFREKGTGTPRLEIMVWLDENSAQPSSKYLGKCTDGINTYKKYWWTRTGDGLEYRSFLLDNPGGVLRQPVNLKALIDLVKPDIDWYVSEVELGTEIWDGSGTIEVKTFQIEINGEIF